MRVPRPYSLGGEASTALYLVSQPLPNNISTIQFEIISRDQGYGNPDNGLWSWFEVSILGSWTEQTVAEFDNLSDLAHVRPTPEEFGDLIQDQGLYFKDIPSHLTPSDSEVSMTIICNAIRPLWQHHTLTWKLGGDDETVKDFLDLLEEGDRLAIWARAKVFMPLEPGKPIQRVANESSVPCMDQPCPRGSNNDSNFGKSE